MEYDPIPCYKVLRSIKEYEDPSPLCVGMSILDLSRYLIYDFYYNQHKREHGDCCQLLNTHTDGLLLKIQTTEDVYKDMVRQADLYDTSDYLKDYPCRIMANKFILGKMKDECTRHPISEYVGLWKKMYSIHEHQESQGCQE